MSRLWLARSLLILGVLLIFISLTHSTEIIFDPNYLLVREIEWPREHARFIALGNSVSGFTIVIVLLVIFFGPEGWRTHQTWWICLLLMLGYFTPFWIGGLINPGFSSEHIQVRIAHILMTGVNLSALFVGRRQFWLPV